MPSPAEAKDRLEQALFEIRRVIAGQDAMLERVLVCLLAQGHLLIEGVPGLAKTLTIKTTASVLGGSFSRIQFTPDLVPSDLVGTRVYRPGEGVFDTELGPVFCNFLLADEINRAPAKLRPALSLEDLKALQRAVFDIYVDPALVSYAVGLATATREPTQRLAAYIAYGASPRGPISLVQAARALALVRGRDYVLAEDLGALAKDALRHRLVLTYQALAEEVSPDSILDEVLAGVPLPRTDLADETAA